MYETYGEGATLKSSMYDLNKPRWWNDGQYWWEACIPVCQLEAQPTFYDSFQCYIVTLLLMHVCEILEKKIKMKLSIFNSRCCLQLWMCLSVPQMSDVHVKRRNPNILPDKFLSRNKTKDVRGIQFFSVMLVLQSDLFDPIIQRTYPFKCDIKL